jgi:hypothetical protein
MLLWMRRTQSIPSQITLLRSIALFSSKLWLNFPRVLSLPYISAYCNFVGIFNLSPAFHMPCLPVPPWKSTKKPLWNSSLYSFFQFLTSCFSKDLTVYSFPFSVTSTMKLRISARCRDRSIDGSENRRTIEQVYKHHTLRHTHTILIMLHTTVYRFTYKH